MGRAKTDPEKRGKQTCVFAFLLLNFFCNGRRLKLDYDHGEMLWYDIMLPMRPRKGLMSADFDHMEDIYYIQYELNFLARFGWRRMPLKFLMPSIHGLTFETSLMVKTTSRHNRSVIYSMF